MRFRFIEDRRHDYPVRQMCVILGVSPAGYYAWRLRVRLIEAVESGASRREAAESLDVSASSGVRWMRF